MSIHNPKNEETYIIHKNIPPFMKALWMEKAVETNRIIKIKWQLQSLKKLLTSTKLSTKNTTSLVKEYNCPNCGTWIFPLEVSTYKFKTDQIFTIKKNHFTCTFKNLIYFLKCIGCGGDYICKTSLTLKDTLMVARQ